MCSRITDIATLEFLYCMYKQYCELKRKDQISPVTLSKPDEKLSFIINVKTIFTDNGELAYEEGIQAKDERILMLLPRKFFIS